MAGINQRILAKIFHEPSVATDKNVVKAGYCLLRTVVVIMTKCSPKVSPCSVIFFSIFPVNIDYYDLQVKTLKLTPHEKFGLVPYYRKLVIKNRYSGGLIET